MNARQTVEKVSTCLLLFLYALAHALAVVSLLAFGLRADGWVLHPVAVGWYGLFVLGSLVLLGRSWRQGNYHWPLVVPPILALAALGAFPATGLLGGAAYAPYDPGDLHEWFVGLNVLSALALSAAALIYRWPRLLLAWATAQGLLLVTCPAWWARLYRWGGLGNPLPVAVLTVGLPLLYVLAARALGVRLPRRWGRWVLVGLTVGIGPTVLAVLRHAAYTQGRGLPLEAVLLPLNLAFGASLMPLPLLAWQTLRERPGEGERRFPWEALVLVLWAATALATSYLTPGRTLPAPGDVQGWQSPDHVVPDAWLPTITWAAWLFAVVRWLLIPYALLGVVGTVLPTRPRLALPAFPEALLWAGVAWLTGYAWDFSRLGFPLRVVVEPRSVLESFLPLPGGVLLLLAGRAWERHWDRMAGGFWRLVTVGSLLALLLWTGQAAWAYGRVILAPLPAWADRWQYAPLPPTLLVGLGLVMHLILLGLGFFALGATLRAWTGTGQVTGQRGLSSLVRAVTPPLLLLAALAGLWWWATAPPVVRTVPLNGATAVPRDTVVHIQMGPEKEWLGLLLGRSGQGIRTHYADTGDTIPGMSGGTSTDFFFDPNGPLRPNAPVGVTIYRTGERPYTLRFTTAGVESPTATPMPDFPGPFGPEATLAPPTPPGEVEAVGYLRPALAGADHAFELDTAQGLIHLVLAEGHRQENLEWLMEHRHLTLVRGRWLSQDPPTLEVVWDQGAARSFNRSTPLADVYTDLPHGYAIEYPAEWVVEQDGEAVWIQNFSGADLPLGYNPLDDLSLYLVNITPERKPLSQLQEAMRGGNVVVEAERAGQVNGQEAVWLTLRHPDEGRQHLVLVDCKGWTLTLSTWQDPALLERMVETVRW